jgi:hypothetical protein
VATVSALLHIGEYTGRVLCGRTTRAVRRRLVLLGRRASLYVGVLQRQQPLRGINDNLGTSNRGHIVLMYLDPQPAFQFYPHHRIKFFSESVETVQ